VRAQREAMSAIAFLDPRSSPDAFAEQMRGFHLGLEGYFAAAHDFDRS